MLDFRSMLGRRLSHCVDPQTYTRIGHAFGRVPIVLNLGDFLQLRPTAQLSLLDDLTRKDENGPAKGPACAAGVRTHPRCVRAAGDEALQRWRSTDRVAAGHAHRARAVRETLDSFSGDLGSEKQTFELFTVSRDPKP